MAVANPEKTRRNAKMTEPQRHKGTKGKQKEVWMIAVPDLVLCHYGELINWSDSMQKEIASRLGVPRRLLGRDHYA